MIGEVMYVSMCGGGGLYETLYYLLNYSVKLYLKKGLLICLK